MIELFQVFYFALKKIGRFKSVEKIRKQPRMREVDSLRIQFESYPVIKQKFYQKMDILQPRLKKTNNNENMIYNFVNKYHMFTNIENNSTNT